MKAGIFSTSKPLEVGGALDLCVMTVLEWACPEWACPQRLPAGATKEAEVEVDNPLDLGDAGSQDWVIKTDMFGPKTRVWKYQ